MAFSTGAKNTATMNVTPLIDILLVLLVTFLLITPVTPQGEEARIPQDSTQKPANPELAVVLQLSKSAGSDTVQLAINQQKVEWGSLSGRLLQIFKTRGDKTLFLTSDREIDFGYIAEAVDAAHAAGVNNVALMAMDKDGKG
jgi:biopolymer transport protein TolR